MYAVVRSGGKQHRVAVGDVVEVERLPGAAGATVRLPAVLVVDDGTVTTDAEALTGIPVTAEVVGAAKGPKIKIFKYKNKTGYRKRQGHRQQLTKLRVTRIGEVTAQTAAANAATAVNVDAVNVDAIDVDAIDVEAPAKDIGKA